MSQRFLTQTERRDLHYRSGKVHPNVVARETRARKRCNRRLTRRNSAKQTPRAPRAPVETKRFVELIEQDGRFEDED